MLSDMSWEKAMEEIPAKERIILLQYNTHLFEGSMATLGVKISQGVDDFVRFFTHDRSEPKDPLVFADEQRSEAIKEKIKQSNADIVALNEVWCDSKMDWFANQLRDVYPYQCLGPKSGVTPQGSGLVLLSKFPIESHTTYIYDRDRSKIQEEESWASKGILEAVIQTPDEKRFVISISHTAGIVDIKQLVSKTDEMAQDLNASNYAKVITGDLNVHVKDQEKMYEEFCRLGARDAWVEVKQGDRGVTIDLPNNKLDQIFSPKKNPNPTDQMQVDRLDRVFYTPPQKPECPSLKPVAACVIRDWTFSWQHDYHYDLIRGRWMSNYVAIRSFELNGHPYLFALKAGNDRAYISRIKDTGMGWTDLGNWKWQSNYVGSAVRTFQLDGQPHIFALKASNDRAYISRINKDGMGWTDLGSWKWQSNYVAIVPFYLGGHPYLFALKAGNDRAYISRINDGGMGWTDLGSWKWQSNYVANAITIFELCGHPYVFALKAGNDRAYISRINDDGMGWTDLGSWQWQSNYIAVVSYQLKGHPYLFSLKETGEAFVSRIKENGQGWEDVSKVAWSPDYIGTCITVFYLNGEPYLFSLKGNDEAWITKLTEPGSENIDLSDHYPLEVMFRFA